MAVDKLLSAREAAERIGVKRVTVLLWAREKKIDHYRIGTKKVLIPEREVTRILQDGYFARRASHDEQK